MKRIVVRKGAHFALMSSREDAVAGVEMPVDFVLCENACKIKWLH